MKKLIILFVSIIAISALGWFAYDLASDQGTIDSELIMFNIDDINTVDRIIITDQAGNKFEMVKNGTVVFEAIVLSFSKSFSRFSNQLPSFANCPIGSF